MSRQLKVYNRFEELILNVRFIPGDPIPIQIEDGTPELQKAVYSLSGHDFDETVIAGNQRQRFEAKWGSAEYLDALAAYWSSNFGWQTRIVETAPMWWNLQTQPGSVNILDVNSATQSLVRNRTFFTTNYIGLTENYLQLTGSSREFGQSQLVLYQNYYAANFAAASQIENLFPRINEATSQSGNLFVAQTRPHTFFRLQPVQEDLEMAHSIWAQYSLAWGVNQPTATVLSKKHDPGIQPSIRVQDALAA